jgi:hypothetical protein
MLDPLCRDCKTRHRLGAEYCPLYKAEKKTAEKKIKEKACLPSTASVSGSPVLGARESDSGSSDPVSSSLSSVLSAVRSKRASTESFDRNAYQREYMRKYRKRQKQP